MKRWAQFAISLALAVLILYALLRHFDLQRTAESVRQANLGLLIIGVTLIVVADLLRGWRWRIWQRNLSYWNSLQVILIGFMGNNILPGRLGEILRAHCAAAKARGDWGRTAALGSIAAERILDGLVLGVVGLVAISVAQVDRRLQWGLFLASLAFAGLTMGLVLSIRHQEWIRRLVFADNRKFPGRLTAFARDKAIQLLDGILPLGTLPRMFGAITATATIWGLEAGACYLVGLAVWHGMSVRIALLFLVVVNFASLVPLTMGGIGTIEVAGPLFLVSAGVSQHLALAMVVLQHAAQYLFTTITGAILYLGGRFHRTAAPNRKAAARHYPEAATSPCPVEETRSRLAKLAASVGLKPAPQRRIELSIIVPAYNEQACLPGTVLDTARAKSKSKNP
jgi:glycosyltransferase 2 family protein